MVIEILTKKEQGADARCCNCGKKLFETTKSLTNTAKNTGILVKIKCNRCGNLNDFCLK